MEISILYLMIHNPLLNGNDDKLLKILFAFLEGLNNF